MKRMVRIVLVAVFVAAVLVIVATPTFARPKFGHEVPTTVCSVVVDKGESGPFEWRKGGKVCWFTPPA